MARGRRHGRTWRWLRGTLRGSGDPFAELGAAYRTPVRVICVCGTKVYDGPEPRGEVDWPCGCGRRWTWAGTHALWLTAVEGDRIIRLPAPPGEPLPDDHPLAQLRQPPPATGG